MHWNEIVAGALFRLAKRRAVRNSVAQEQTRSLNDYSAWHSDELGAQFGRFLDGHLVENKDVLDFGCGSGGLAVAVSRLGARSIYGIDLNRALIEAAIKAAAATGAKVEFRVATKADAIPFVDRSFDVVLCFDVLEHVIEYESIVREWSRVLRPHGRIVISWTPYFYPYGHHLYRYAPIPWMHVFCSDAVMNMVASRVVNSAEFKPAYWDLDEKGRRMDRFAGTTNLGDLNRLTIAKFERICTNQGFKFLRREFQPLSPFRKVPNADRLCRLPGVREFLTASVAYEIAVS